MQSKRGKQLFKNQMSAGPSDLFSFLITEINNTYNTSVAYLKGQASFLDVSHQAYINECFKFVFYSALIYHDEPELMSFFSNLRQLYQPKEKQDHDVTCYENFLNATIFFCNSITIKQNALRALFITIFQPVLLNTKVSKVQLPNGTFKK